MLKIIIINLLMKRAPVAQVVVHPTSKQEVFGVSSLSRHKWKFSKYCNRCSGGIIKSSVTSREEVPCRGANYLGVSG